MTNSRLTGLIAATYTPFHDDGTINLSQVVHIVEHLQRLDVDGLYVCGSTGEGMSLTSAERMAVAEAYMSAAEGRLRVIVQVGHNSLFEARSLAAHAANIGAYAVSANAPSYFPVATVDLLVDCMAEIAAAAPDLPFYYYHIPQLTGAALDMVEFLSRASDRIPNLAGLKYTSTTIHEYQRCVELDGQRFDILWGCDEMLLSALAVGAQGAVGSTYNVAAPLYREIMDAFVQGDVTRARALQSRSVALANILSRRAFHPSMKAVLAMLGCDCGPCRLPHPRVSETDTRQLRRELDEIGLFDWDDVRIRVERANAMN